MNNRIVPQVSTTTGRLDNVLQRIVKFLPPTRFVYFPCVLQKEHFRKARQGVILPKRDFFGWTRLRLSFFADITYTKGIEIRFFQNGIGRVEWRRRMRKRRAGKSARRRRLRTAVPRTRGERARYNSR